MLRLSALLLLALLTACSSNKKTHQPAELTAFEPQARVEVLWSSSVGKGQGKTLNRLRPVIADGTVYVAAVNGRVEALGLEDGRRQWRQDLEDVRLSGGVGLGPQQLFVSSLNGELIALDRSTGRVLWVTELGSQVLAPAASDGEGVFVQTVDGKVIGVDLQNGQRLWAYDGQMPVLTQWGTSAPVTAGGQVLAGLANGKLVSLAANSGQLLWEGRVAIPQGRSEIERLVDIDGDPLISTGGRVYAVSHQGYLAAFSMSTGRLEWRQEASSHVGLSEGFGNLYSVQADGTVQAYETARVQLRWQQSALSWRDLTAATPLSSYVLVADREGYVHALSQVDGSLAARYRTDRSGVAVAPVVSGDIAVVYGNSGKLRALRLLPRD